MSEIDFNHPTFDSFEEALAALNTDDLNDMPELDEPENHEWSEGYELSNQSTQAELEILYSKYQVGSIVRRDFIDMGLVEMLEEDEIDVKLGLAVLANCWIHKQPDFPTLAGSVFHHFRNHPDALDGIVDPAAECAAFIENMVDQGYLYWYEDTRTFEFHFMPTEETEEQLEIFQYPLPMIEPPQEIHQNNQTGYQTIRGSLLLQDNHHTDDICLDHLNRVNSIPLRINTDTLAHITNTWPSLAKRKPGETMVEYREKLRQFEKYDAVTKDVIQSLMMLGDRFWMTHKYDFRGRTYCQGYHVNYQGHSWNKAVVEFADGESIYD